MGFVRPLYLRRRLMLNSNCQICKTEFLVRHPLHIYCSKKCRNWIMTQRASLRPRPKTHRIVVSKYEMLKASHNKLLGLKLMENEFCRDCRPKLKEVLR